MQSRTLIRRNAALRDRLQPIPRGTAGPVVVNESFALHASMGTSNAPIVRASGAIVFAGMSGFAEGVTAAAKVSELLGIIATISEAAGVGARVALTFASRDGISEISRATSSAQFSLSQVSGALISALSASHAQLGLSGSVSALLSCHAASEASVLLLSVLRCLIRAGADYDESFALIARVGITQDAQARAQALQLISALLGVSTSAHIDAAGVIALPARIAAALGVNVESDAVLAFGTLDGIIAVALIPVVRGQVDFSAPSVIRLFQAGERVDFKVLPRKDFS